MTKAELNSWKAEVDNAARSYQQFCDRNLALKNREDELQRSINELEAKKTELQRTAPEHPAGRQENSAYNDNLNPGIKQAEAIFTNDVLMPL